MHFDEVLPVNSGSLVRQWWGMNDPKAERNLAGWIERCRQLEADNRELRRQTARLGVQQSRGPDPEAKPASQKSTRDYPQLS
jgi:hypothetical protein